MKKLLKVAVLVVAALSLTVVACKKEAKTEVPAATEVITDVITDASGDVIEATAIIIDTTADVQ